VPSLRRVPPGRAGRIWLQRRLGVARRAAGLLDQKLRILLHEQERFTLLVQRTREEWEQQCREAETWLLRSALLGGQRALRHAADGGTAEVTVTWASAMGVRYPAETSCATPDPEPDAASPDNAALVEAVAAFRGALAAGVQQAAAEAALRTVDAEVAATRRRLQAVEDRWIPRLDEALAAVRLGLDEAERSEGVRLRWAAGLPGERRTPP